MDFAHSLVLLAGKARCSAALPGNTPETGLFFRLDWRLTAYSDYSLRRLMYAALKGQELVTIQEVADVYGISKNHLARKPDKIGLGEIIRATEEDFTIVECFVSWALNAYLAVLDEYTLADLRVRHPALERVLAVA